MESDFAAARRRLLTKFPNVHEVIATTAPATLLVLYDGRDEAEAWVDALLDSAQTAPVKANRRLSSCCDGNGSPANGSCGDCSIGDGNAAA
jgi:hypothetical protein